MLLLLFPFLTASLPLLVGPNIQITGLCVLPVAIAGIAHMDSLFQEDQRYIISQIYFRLVLSIYLPTTFNLQITWALFVRLKDSLQLDGTTTA